MASAGLPMEAPQLVLGATGAIVSVVGVAFGLWSAAAALACAVASMALAAALPSLCTSAAPSGIRYVLPNPGRPGSAASRLQDHIRSCTGAGPAAWLQVVCRAEFIAPSCWALEHEAVLAHTHLGRTAKESIVVGVSRGIGSRASTHAHEMVLAAGGDAHKDSAFHREDARLEVRDTMALNEWAAATAVAVSPKAVTAPLPFSLAQGPEVLAAVVFGHFQARVCRVFVDDAALLHSRIPAALYGAVVRPFELSAARRGCLMHNEPGAVFRDGAPAAKEASLCSSDLPLERVEEELPAKLRAAFAPNHSLLLAVEAWSRACARGARGVLRKESRDVVRRFAVSGWESGDGCCSGHEWAAVIANTTPHEHDRGLVRLALHTIAAPELILGRDVGTEMSRHGDVAIVTTVAFAAAEAAKQVGNRVAASLS